MINGQLTIATRPRATPTADIVAAYRETGSVWEAGKQLGIAGQSVHERLRKIGYPMANRNWTPEECDELRQLITEGLTLSRIAERIGRPYAGIACKASELGLRSSQKGRGRKPPRGSAPTKTATLRHMKGVETYDGMVTHYARANGLDIEVLVQSLEKHCPDRWRAYVASRSSLAMKACPYCGTEFVPMGGKQIWCTRKCGGDARTDASYFGGRRRETVGLAEGICQLCLTPDDRLSSHHVLGKENDPENEHLVALCRMCHKLVTILGARAWVELTEIWERLAELSLRRALGPAIAAGTYEAERLHVQVEVINWDEWQKPSNWAAPPTLEEAL